MKIQTLQGIRALATIGVFLFHSGFLLQGTFPVTLFFMLSGFVMYYTKHDLDYYSSYREWIVKYVLKKIKAFYPLHLLTFIIAIFIGGFLKKEITREVITSGILNLLLVHPFVEKYSLTYNGLSWFLAVTIFLYFAGYFIIKIIDKTRMDIKVLIAIVWIIMALLNGYNRLGGDLYLYCNPMYRVWDFTLGMLLAKFYLTEKKELKYATLYEASIVTVFVIQYVLSLLVGEAPGYYSVIFSVALVVFAYGQGVVSKLLCGEGLNKIAENSFEFYMFHELMLRVFRKVFGNIELSYLLKCTVIAIPALVCTVGLVIAYKRIRLYANKKGYLKLFI